MKTIVIQLHPTFFRKDILFRTNIKKLYSYIDSNGLPFNFTTYMVKFLLMEPLEVKSIFLDLATTIELDIKQFLI